MTDIQAEVGVVATIIAHPEFLTSISHMKAKYFSDMTNACVFWAVQTLITNGVSNLDMFNIESMINSNAAVKRNFGETDLGQYLELSELAARDTTEELVLLANTVASMSYKRDMRRFASNVARACENEDNTLDDINELVEDQLDSISNQYVFSSDSVMFGEKVDEIWESIIGKRNADGTYGLTSLIPTFEKYFTYVEGELVLVAGATGKGKSAFFLNETIHQLKNGFGVLYIDTELSDETFYVRCLSNLTGVDGNSIKRGTYSESAAKSIESAKGFLRNATLIHEYLPEFNKSKIEQLVRKWKLQAGINFVVYDYIKPEARLGTGAAEVSNGLGQICDFLKNTIAGTLELPVLAGAQINTSTGTLADSQKPLRYCSTYMLWREKTQDELKQDGLECGNFCCEIGKNRNGMSTSEGDYIDIQFDGNKMRIYEAKPHKVQETPFDNRPGAA